jgi:hypothetical protein
MVGTAEYCVDSLFSDLMRKSMGAGNAITRTAIGEIELQASATWKQREDAYSRYFQVNLRGLGSATDFFHAVDIRNIVAHGQGRITARLINKNEIRQRYRSIGVEVADGRILLGLDSILRCESVCISFISNLDINLAPR